MQYACTYVTAPYPFLYLIYSIQRNKNHFLLESKDLCKLIVQFACSHLIKCYVKVPPSEKAIKENLYPNLLDFIQGALFKICDFCLPSAQKPVCYLECPFDHENNNELPHLPINEINNESDVICKIKDIPIPKDYYKPLFIFNCKLYRYLRSFFVCFAFSNIKSR